MAQYQKVITVLSQPPDLRKDFEVTNLLPWFRKKSDLFRGLKTDILFDIIKHCQLETKQRDDVIIRQGDQGECMYILLMGQVTIFIQYASKGDTEDKEVSPPSTPKDGKPVDIRTVLGTYVTSLGSGATFGEVALISEDCIRTASIVSDEQTDLIVVDRTLYNRSVKAVLAKEFEDKSNFVNNSPFFSNWAPKYKKQLVMALQKTIVPYDSQLIRQAAPVMGIYFILRGEVKVVIDPSQHRLQYSKYFTDEQLLPKNGKAYVQQELAVEELIRSMCGKDRELQKSLEHSYRRRAYRRHPLDVCYLGVNESLGDIEVLLELDTYMQTAICTRKTEVLFLEMKHYERLLAKRNPQCLDAMKSTLELRLRSRTTKHMEKQIPLLSQLISVAEEYNQLKDETNGTRRIVRQDSRPSMKTGSDFDSFVPPYGALVDMFGPGTVFYRIRQREHAKTLRQAQRGRKLGGVGRTVGAIATFGGQPNGVSAQETAQQPDNFQKQLFLPHQGGQQVNRADAVDYQTSDPVLTRLENRMKAWLTGSDSAPSKSPRIAKLQRSVTLTQAPDISLKPGMKVLVRSRENSSYELLRERAPSRESVEDEDDDKLLHHGQAFVDAALDRQQVRLESKR